MLYNILFLLLSLLLIYIFSGAIMLFFLFCGIIIVNVITYLQSKAVEKVYKLFRNE